MKLKVGDLVQVGIDMPDGAVKASLTGVECIDWSTHATICIIKEVHQQYARTFYTVFSPTVHPMLVFPHEIKRL